MSFRIGDRITHRTRGPGTVVNIPLSQGLYENVDVEFDVLPEMGFRGTGYGGSYRAYVDYCTLVDEPQKLGALRRYGPFKPIAKALPG